MAAPSPPAVEIRNSGVEGSALFTTRQITQGELCFSEPVLFHVRTDALPSQPIRSRAEAMLAMQSLPASAVAKAIEAANLTNDQLEMFRKSPGESDLQKFQIISYDMCELWSETPIGFGYGVFGSYLNHSCRPNAIYYWDDTKSEMQVRALTAIGPGEEICIDYLATDEWLTFEERQERLKTLLKLDDCQCVLCKSSDDEAKTLSLQNIQANERELRSLVEQVDSQRSDPFAAPPDDATRTQQDRDIDNFSDSLVSCVVEELGGLIEGSALATKWADPRLATTYALVYHAKQRKSGTQDSHRYQEQAKKVLEICFGVDQPNVDEYLVRVESQLYRASHASVTEAAGED